MELEELENYETLQTLIEKEKEAEKKFQGVKRYYKLFKNLKNKSSVASDLIDYKLSGRDESSNLSFVSIKLKEQVYRGKRTIGVQMRDITAKMRSKVQSM